MILVPAPAHSQVMKPLHASRQVTRLTPKGARFQGGFMGFL